MPAVSPVLRGNRVHTPPLYKLQCQMQITQQY